MPDVPDDILRYHASLDADARPICDRLLEIIQRELPDADSKVWHGHPVWFLERNPVVGYDRLKASVRLLFWSGQSFPTPGLHPEGSFRAAELRYTTPDQVDAQAVSAWLADAREYQWNYRDIRTNRGLVPLRGVAAPA